jgi:hypothetical protein
MQVNMCIKQKRLIFTSRVNMKKIFILFVFSILTFAQSGNQIPGYSQSSSYIIAKENQVLMNINLWGHVQKPGAYEIPITYGIVELISHSGGPTGTANLDDIKIIRKGNEVIRVNLKKFITEGDESVLVQLQPGDTVVVGGTLRNVFSQVLSYIRDIAVVITSIILIAR